MRLLSAALALSLIATPALAQDTQPQKDGPPITWVKRDDPEMNAAIAESKRTLPDFFKHFASPASDETMFEVKFNIAPGPRFEYIWAYDLKYDGGTLTGVLVDDAIMTSDKGGDRVPIKTDAIIDWGYMKAGVMQGNRTMRVLMPRLPADQAAAIRKAMGW